MLNNQPTTIKSINNLPDDVLQLIFANLSPQALVNIKLVSQRWLRVVSRPELWRNLINQHFPFLANYNAEDYQDYLKNPQDLFIKKSELIRYTFKLVPEKIGLSIIFASLRGEIDKIQSYQMSDKHKNVLYTLAAMNGSKIGLSKLNDEDRKALLLMTAVLGEPDAFDKINDTEKERVIIVRATVSGNHKAFDKISDAEKRRAFIDAAEVGILLGVNTLLSHYSHVITSEDKGTALLRATVNANFEVVEVLLNQVGHDIDRYSRGRALIVASENGHIRLVEALLKLNSAGYEYSGLTKIEALQGARFHKHANIENVLLSYWALGRYAPQHFEESCAESTRDYQNVIVEEKVRPVLNQYPVAKRKLKIRESEVKLLCEEATRFLATPPPDNDLSIGCRSKLIRFTSR